MRTTNDIIDTFLESVVGSEARNYAQDLRSLNLELGVPELMPMWLTEENLEIRELLWSLM